MFSAFFHIVAWISSSFLLWPIFYQMDVPHSTYPFISWWARVVFTFLLLWQILLWTFMYKILCTYVFDVSWVYSRISESYSNCIFSLLKKCQTISQSSCTIFFCLIFKDLFILEKQWAYVWVGKGTKRECSSRFPTRCRAQSWAQPMSHHEIMTQGKTKSETLNDWATTWSAAALF